MKMQIFHEIKYDLKGYPRSYKTTFMPKSSSTFLYGPTLVKIGMNANIMKTQYDLKCHFYVMEKFCDFFTLRLYYLMDNFCPCLKKF